MPGAWVAQWQASARENANRHEIIILKNKEVESPVVVRKLTHTAGRFCEENIATLEYSFITKYNIGQ